jgi:type I restriction enzyme S subunit
MKKGWQIKKLGEVCVLDKHQGIHKNLPYVGLEHVESHTGRFVGSTEPVGVKSSTFKFSSEHVLYGRLRPYLNKVMLPDFTGHCSTEIFPLKPRSGLLRKFLQYWFLRDATVEQIDATSTGARMPRANMNAVLDFQFPLPPLLEQQRTVDILDEAFKGIATATANAEQNLHNARAIFDSHLESVFTQHGDGWVETPLSELCDVKHGFAFKSEFFTDNGDYILLTPGNFYETGGYRDRGDKQKYYAGTIPDGFVLSEGDMLVAMTEQAAGLLGSPILIPESGKFLHNQRLGLVTKKPGVPWTNEFFFHVFNTQAVRKEIHDSASGVKVRHTSPTKIGEVVVAFPTSLPEQKRIVSTLADLTTGTQRLATLYQRKSAALEALKKSLLHQAFAGHLSDRAMNEAESGSL